MERKIGVALSGLTWAMTFLLIAQVFFRYVVNASLPWGEELSRYAMIWIAFIGAVVLVRTNQMTAFQIFANSNVGKFDFLTGLLRRCSTAVFFCVLAVSGVKLVVLALPQSSAALNAPMTVVYSIIPISSIICVLVVVFSRWLSRNR